MEEIGNIGLSLQAQLLQVLQDGEFSRWGRGDVQVHSRVLAATNKDLKAAGRDGRFREDLYYRLDVVNILVPPLGERRKEIPIFLKHFLDVYDKQYGK